MVFWIWLVAATTTAICFLFHMMVQQQHFEEDVSVVFRVCGSTAAHAFCIFFWSFLYFFAAASAISFVNMFACGWVGGLKPFCSTRTPDDSFDNPLDWMGTVVMFVNYLLVLRVLLILFLDVCVARTPWDMRDTLHCQSSKFEEKLRCKMTFGKKPVRQFVWWCHTEALSHGYSWISLRHSLRRACWSAVECGQRLREIILYFVVVVVVEWQEMEL